MLLLIFILIALVSAIACHTIAKKIGANPVFWGVMGVIFGPFAIPFVFLAKNQERK